MAIGKEQIERRKQLEQQLVDRAIDLSNAQLALRVAQTQLDKTKAELAKLDEIEGRDK